MRLITSEQERRLLTNGRWHRARIALGQKTTDLRPVVRLFYPWSGAYWLLSELDPDDPDSAFGLHNPATGLPEIGCVRLSDLQMVVVPSGLRIERDSYFRAVKTLQGYFTDARHRKDVVASA